LISYEKDKYKNIAERSSFVNSAILNIWQKVRNTNKPVHYDKQNTTKRRKLDTSESFIVAK